MRYITTYLYVYRLYRILSIFPAMRGVRGVPR